MLVVYRFCRFLYSYSMAEWPQNDQSKCKRRFALFSVLCKMSDVTSVTFNPSMASTATKECMASTEASWYREEVFRTGSLIYRILLQLQNSDTSSLNSVAHPHQHLISHSSWLSYHYNNYKHTGQTEYKLYIMVVNIIVLIERILKLRNAAEDDILFGLIVVILSVSSVGLNVSATRIGL